MKCVHLGDETSIRRRRVELPIHQCHLYDECTIQKSRIRNCEGCADFVSVDCLDMAKHWVDHLRIVDRKGDRTHVLRNFLVDGAAFLVCGGPSLKQLNTKRLEERGVWSLGINNVAAYAPVNAFICSDPPSKFHNGIFLDPQVMKLLPIPKLTSKSRGRLRNKKADGTFEGLDTYTTDCPNTWGFERRSWLACDDTWFTANGAAWGNHDEGVKRTGEQKTVNTMFLGLRLLQYLGAKTIFLLGVDFKMRPEAGLTENYSFGEKRDPGAVSSNNRQYEVAGDWLHRLRPVFEKFGYRVYNCNQFSHLRAFEYVPFDDAVNFVKGKMPPEPWNLEDWYTK